MIVVATEPVRYVKLEGVIIEELRAVFAERLCVAEDPSSGATDKER